MPSDNYATNTLQSKPSWIGNVVQRLIDMMSLIPDSLIAVVGRFSIAAVFWLSGQTKVDGLAINFINGEFLVGQPQLSFSANMLFANEYQLPLIPPEWAAVMAASAEHVFAFLILIGLATRLSALALLVMTLVIQIFVYPGAYSTHGVWAAVLLYLMAKGPGKLSLDHWIRKKAWK